MAGTSINLNWTANSASPLYDQAYQNGDRPAGGGVGEYSGLTPTHYLSAAASGGGAGTLGDPWTIDEAMTNAVAGNVIGMLPGTYIGSNPGGTLSYTPAFRPSNSGTSGTPIIFTAQNPAVANSSNRTEIYSGATVAESGWPAIGDLSRSYVKWYGVYLNENNANGKSALDSAPYYSRSADGAGIYNSEIVGTNHITVDNHSGIRIEYSDGFTESNNKIHGFAGHTNASGIIIYKSNTFELGNGETYDCEHGVQLKGSEGVSTIWGGEIHNKLIHDCTHMFRFHGPILGPSNELTKIYNCIGYNFSWICEFTSSGTHVGEQDGLHIFNNTFDDITGNDPAAMWIAHNYSAEGNIPRNNKFFNNIIESTGVYWGQYSATIDLAYFNDFMYCDYNAVNVANGSVINASSGANLDGTTIAQWQAVPQDVNTQFESTTFDNQPSRDYHLPGGSPRLTQGKDLLGEFGAVDATIPVGAYVTGSEIIGVDV